MIPIGHKYSNRRSQQGNVLIISLLMLVIMTILVVTSMEDSTVNLKVVGNVQNQRSAEAAAQAVIEELLAMPSVFLTKTGSKIDVPDSENIYGWRSIVARSIFLGCPCGGQTPADYSEEVIEQFGEAIAKSQPMACWNVMATINDDATGTQVTIHQGIRRNQECPGS